MTPMQTAIFSVGIGLLLNWLVFLTVRLVDACRKLDSMHELLWTLHDRTKPTAHPPEGGGGS